MLKDFIKDGEYSQYLELIPDEDFYTKLPSKEEDIKEGDNQDVMLASVCIKTKYDILYNLGKKSDHSDITAYGSLITNQYTIYIDAETGQKKTITERSRFSIKFNLPNKDSKNKPSQLLSALSIYYFDAQNNITNIKPLTGSYVIKGIYPGLPENISSTYPEVKLLNLVSAYQEWRTLFGNQLIDEWKKSPLVLLTK